MHIRRIAISNYRLLRNVSFSLEAGTTLIVGRNNSGKTSLAEFFRRILSDSEPRFKLEDFHLSAHERFWNAYEIYAAQADHSDVRTELPAIVAEFVIDYGTSMVLLSDLVVDLNPDCHELMLRIRYELQDGKIDDLFGGIALDNTAEIGRRKSVFFQVIKDRVANCYKANCYSYDPTDAENRQAVGFSRLTQLIQGGFVNAQRGLDDVTHRDRDVLGRVLGTLFTTALSESAHVEDRAITQKIQEMVQQIQRDINENFDGQLSKLLPTFELFGYPGLPDPGLLTETLLDARGLIDNHTRIRYTGINGVSLPETYNGLGSRNLIFILLRLLELFKEYIASSRLPGMCLIFIEEPEAHLHPQMQEVFVDKVNELAEQFARTFGAEKWPVQFIISTHSAHIANRASFRSIRYFLARTSMSGSICETCVKDLLDGFGSTGNTEFLHQYMTLTGCNLLFADKAILIEGTAERLLLPKMIAKVDSSLPVGKQRLSSQYIAVLEVGGAYAHCFFELLDYLEVPTLIITDIDAIDHTDKRRGCMVSKGTRTSNACLTTWFADPDITPGTLLTKSDADKVIGKRRIAYQVPEACGPTAAACGRSFEDAFVLANPSLFELDDSTHTDSERVAWEMTRDLKKSQFALKHAILQPDWAVPRYIREGLEWLAWNGGARNESAKDEAPLDTSMSQ